MRNFCRHLVRIISIVCFLLLPFNNSAAGTVWEPTTHPFDPTCANCTKVGGEDGISHYQDIQVMIDQEVDDLMAQWVRCLTSFMDCLDSGNGISHCMKVSNCPDACKVKVVSRIGNSKDIDTQFAAIDEVFMSEGGLCALKGEEVIVP